MSARIGGRVQMGRLAPLLNCARLDGYFEFFLALHLSCLHLWQNTDDTDPNWPKIYPDIRTYTRHHIEALCQMAKNALDEKDFQIVYKALDQVPHLDRSPVHMIIEIRLQAKFEDGPPPVDEMVKRPKSKPRSVKLS